MVWMDEEDGYRKMMEGGAYGKIHQHGIKNSNSLSLIVPVRIQFRLINADIYQCSLSNMSVEHDRNSIVNGFGHRRSTQKNIHYY